MRMISGFASLEDPDTDVYRAIGFGKTFVKKSLFF